MAIIGIEINDTGILAAAGNPPQLIALDGHSQESPGFALPQKKGLLVGKKAASKAHFFPRQILDHFWDQFNTEPLKKTGKQFPLNHAEIVFRHLSLIWQQLKNHGDEIAMAVPSFYNREQLGLILGIAQELGMPIKGFVPLSLAVASQSHPEKMLLHLDIHLHRIEVVYLEQGENLAIRDCATTFERGLQRLYRKLADMIAQEFVRTTRFDPFHQAASEQELYDRLPGTLPHFKHNSSLVFEIAGGSTPYSITLKRENIIREAETVYGELLRLIKRMQNKRDEGRTSLALQMSNRLARLPGCKEMLATLKEAPIIELERGAAALALREIWHQLAAQTDSEGISFFKSRPWHRRQQARDRAASGELTGPTAPTHLLYRSIAYPATEKPLIIGCSQEGKRNDITIVGESAEVPLVHCVIKLRGRDIILEDRSETGTFVDEQRVNGSITLKIGQVIRVGNSAEQLQVIACLK